MTHPPSSGAAPAPTLYIRTFGCQMNAHDSGRMVALMQGAGYTLTEDPEGADVVIVNTCEVRDKADQKMLSAVGRLRETKDAHPGQVVVVAGCGAQLRGARLLERNAHVDVVLGPDQIAELPALVAAVRHERVPRVATDWWQGAGADPAARLEGEFPHGEVTAFVTAMTGCDNCCSYCIVPTTRGHERSRPVADILEEVRGLAQVGVREVTLLGQSVNAYGRTLDGAPPFAELLHQVAAVEGVARIRFMTSHPRFVDDALVRAFSSLEAVCSHLHLPVQSGSDRILLAMRRRYDRQLVLERIQALRAARPELALTTDVIVGFPGETEADFTQTLDLVRQVAFDNMFMFAYSERPGTPAAVHPDPLPAPVRAERLARLAEVQAPFTRRGLDRHVGRSVQVLVEGRSARDPEVCTGRCSQNIVVNFRGTAAPGLLVSVRVEEAKANTLYGTQQP
ncbi:MAG: tRNA (N6-isopentenyl adenosine(37)-C2)-methylthiotransferase MiaB [Pseudomonadota bacterium]